MEKHLRNTSRCSEVGSRQRKKNKVTPAMMGAREFKRLKSKANAEVTWESSEAGESHLNDVLKNVNDRREGYLRGGQTKITLTQGLGEGDGDSIGARVSGRRRSILGAGRTSWTPLGKRRNSKCVKRVAEIKSESDVSCWSGLPRHLVILIIARLPFRNVVQTSSLSKTWRLTFEQDALFQAEVSRSASSWASYAPLYVDWSERSLFGYESRSHTWHKLPMHWHIQEDHVDEVELDIRSMDGSLCGMLGSRYGSLPREVTSRTVFVCNLFTKRWRELPPPPIQTFPYFMHVVRELNRAYKVLFCSEMLADVQDTTTFIAIDLQIFDSRDGSWSVESCRVNVEGNITIPRQGELSYPKGEGYTSVVKDGFLILLLLNHSKLTFSLVLFDLKERAFATCTLRGRLYKGYRPSAALVVCESDVLLVMKEYWWSGIVCERRVTIFRLELDPLEIVQVSKAPREMVDLIWRQPVEKQICRRLTVASCSNDSIYVGSKGSGKSLCYNVTTKEWHFINSAPYPIDEFRRCEWKSLTYQPGLDPYLTI